MGARFTGGLALALPALVVALFSGGCATWRGRAGGQESGGRIALRSVPEIREVGGRGDRGVLEAFFRASGVAVGEDALAEMIPDWSAEGALKAGAVRRAALELLDAVSGIPEGEKQQIQREIDADGAAPEHEEEERI